MQDQQPQAEAGKASGAAVTTVVDRGVATLTLSRPAARNALTIDMIEALHAALDAIEADASIRLVVLRGDGGHLCAGADVKALLAAVASGSPADADLFLAREYALDLRLARLPIPCVAVADGVTMGGGLGLSFGAYLVATTRSRFAMPESRLGFLPDVGATWELKKRLGLPLARYLAWTSESWSGEEAFRWGFADALVTPEEVDGLLASLARAARGEPGPRLSGSTGITFLHSRVAGRVPASEGRRAAAGTAPAPGRETFVRRHFGLPAPPDVRRSLERAARGAEDAAERDWARGALATLGRRSPVSIWAGDLLLRLDYEALAREAAEGAAGPDEAAEDAWPAYLRAELDRAGVDTSVLREIPARQPRALALAVEFLFASALFRHPDFAAGVGAFRDKREPEFPSAAVPLGVHRALFLEPSGWTLLRHAARLARDPFWVEVARQELDWMEPPVRGYDGASFPCVRWFADGTLNASVEALDRWVAGGRGDRTAFVWEGDRIDGDRRPLEQRSITYAALLEDVRRCAAALRALGVRRGDSLVLYMPNIIETYVVQLAAARVGAVYHPVFAGFAREELSDRLHLMGARLLLTVDGAFRKGEVIQYKRDFVDPALRDFVPVETALAAAAAVLAERGVDPDGAVLERARAVLADKVTVEKVKMRALLARELTGAAEAAGGAGGGRAGRGASGDLASLLFEDGAPFAARIARAAARLDREAEGSKDAVSPEERALPADLAAVVREFAARLETFKSPVEKVVVLQKLGTRGEAGWVEGRDVRYDEFVAQADPAGSEPEPMSAEDPLFVMFTSGSTGKPKGLVHTHGGYLTRLPFLIRTLFGLSRDQRILTVADPGWITGQSYVCWGPLAYGMTSVLVGFVPTEDRLWAAIERYRVNFLKTGVTGIRASMGDDPEHIRSHDLSSLRHRGGDAILAAIERALGAPAARFTAALRAAYEAHGCVDPSDWPALVESAAGSSAESAPAATRALEIARGASLDGGRYTSCSCAEPLDAAVQAWWEAHIGPMQNCWWRTEDAAPETGAAPAAFPQTPDAAARPLPWAEIGVFVIRDEEGARVPPRRAAVGEKGTVFVRHNPGIARGTWAAPGSGPAGAAPAWTTDPRFRDIYHADVPGWHNTGDAAVVNPNGTLTFLGRDDEVLNVSGHRVGTQEIEGAVRGHAAVANVAAIGIPAEVRGDNPVLFVKLRPGFEGHGLLDNQLREAVAEVKGSHVAPTTDFIFYVANLPTTKSGKILRRFLKYAAALDRDTLAVILERLRDPAARAGLAAADRETLAALFPPLLRQGRAIRLGSVATVDRMEVVLDILVAVARRRELDVTGLEGGAPAAGPAAATAGAGANAASSGAIAAGPGEAAADAGSIPYQPYAAADEAIYRLGRTDFRPGIDPLPAAQEAWAMVRDAWGRPVHGEPDKAMVRIVEPVPRDPEPNDVIVQNLYCGSTHNVLHALLADPASPFDWHRQPYHVLGSGAVCRVVSCGREVDRQGLFHPGQLAINFPAVYRVLDPRVSEDAMHAGFEIQGFETPGGTLRPFDRLQATQLLPMPRGLTLEQAGSFMLNLVTVYRALTRRLQVSPGQRVLIEGATGGTGGHAVEVARRLGARVTGIVSDEERGRRVIAAGAAAWLNRADEAVKDLWTPVPDDPAEWDAWEAAGAPLLAKLAQANDGALADAVVSFTGRPAFGRLVQLLAPGGRLAFFGAFRGYCLRFLGKAAAGATPPAASAAAMLERAGLRPGMGVLVHYGAAAGAQDDDPAAIDAIQAAAARSARVVALTNTDAQSARLNRDARLASCLLGTVSLESLRRGSRFEWPDRMPDYDRDPRRYERFENHTLKPLATAVGRLLRAPGEDRGQPDIVVARGDEDTLAADLFMVRPFTGAVVYTESRRRAYTLYAPQVWMRQRRVYFPTFEVIGAHMGNPQQGREVIDWIAQGLITIREPRVYAADEAPAAFQAMHTNAAAGSFVVHLTSPGRGLATEREIDEANGALFFDEKYVTVRLDAVRRDGRDPAAAGGTRTHIARVTLRGEGGRPPTLARDAVYQIGDAFRRLLEDERVAAVVLTGEGSVAFLAGQDLRQLHDEVQDFESALTIARDAQRIFDAVEAFPRPVVAVVNGVALGGGHELLMCAHYRLAVGSPRVRLAQPEIDLGIVPGFAATQRLTRLLVDRLGLERGTREALEMILGGRHYEVDEALRLGLLDEVVASDALQRACALAAACVPDGRADGAAGDGVLERARAARARARAAWESPMALPPGFLDDDARLGLLLRQALDPAIGRDAPAVHAVEATLLGLREGFTAGAAREALLFARLVIDERYGRRGIRRFLDRQEQPPLPPRPVEFIDARGGGGEGA